MTRWQAFGYGVLFMACLAFGLVAFSDICQGKGHAEHAIALVVDTIADVLVLCRMFRADNEVKGA